MWNVDVNERPEVADNRDLGLAINSISDDGPPPNQQKKIVIPAIISTSRLYAAKRVGRMKADPSFSNSHPHLDGLLNQCHFI